MKPFLLGVAVAFELRCYCVTPACRVLKCKGPSRCTAWIGSISPFVFSSINIKMKYMKIFKLIKSWATICEIEVYTYKGQIVQIPSNRHWNAHHHLSGALDMMIAHLPCVRQRRTMWEHKVFTYFCWIWNFGTPTSSGVIETMLGNPFSPIPRPKSWNLRVREKSCPRSWDRCPDQIQFQGGRSAQMLVFCHFICSVTNHFHFLIRLHRLCTWGGSSSPVGVEDQLFYLRWSHIGPLLSSAIPAKIALVRLLVHQVSVVLVDVSHVNLMELGEQSR